MQETLIRSSFHRSQTFSEFSNIEDELSLPDAKNGMFSKTQFFSRIGMGVKSIESMSHENRRKMTALLQERDSDDEDQCSTAPEVIPEGLRTSLTRENSKTDSDTSIDRNDNQDPEEFVKNNLVRQNLLFKTQGSPRCLRTSQSLSSMSSQDSPLDVICNEVQEKGLELERESQEGSSGSFEGDFSMNVLNKTDEQVRSCYYNRLIQMKILKLTPTRKNQSILIFDWDDTLLCTSHLVILGVKSVTSVMKSVLKPLDEAASKLLNKATESGNVYIITNAEDGWVQYSAQVFLPKTFATLKEKNITIISARSCYEQAFPGDKAQWKKEAFRSLMNYFEKDVVTNLVCIGDSNEEIEAAYELGKKFDKAVTKTIKFKEHPKPEELIKQQNLMIEKFDQIFVGLRNVAIRLEKKSI